MRKSRWVWRALVGGVILGFPAGALLFVRVPVLNVIDVTADRKILAVQIRAGESLVVSYRDSGTRALVSQTFEVAADDLLVSRETTFGPPSTNLPEVGPMEEYHFPEGMPHRASRVRLRELAVFVHPSSNHTLVVKGRVLLLSRQVAPDSLVAIRVAREFWWQRSWGKWWRR